MDESTARGGAIVAASYLKRWLERRYDTLMDSPIGEQLKLIDRTSKYGIEAALYVLTAVLNHKLDDSSPMKTIIATVAMDFGPEMAKRILNGDSMGEPTTKRSFGAGSGELLLEMMIYLPEASLAELLEWLAGYPPQQRKVIIGRLRTFSADQLQRLMMISREERTRMFQISLGLGESALTTAMAEGVDGTTNRVKGLRTRLSKTEVKNK